MSDVSLPVFLAAQLDADEAAAKAAGGAKWMRGYWVLDFEDGREVWERADGDDGVSTDTDDPTDSEVVVYDEGHPDRGQADHIARHDPARVLAEVASKRAILALHDGVEGECRVCLVDPMSYYTEMEPDPCPTLRHLAQPFAGAPGWRAEWATEEGGAA